MPSKPLPVVTLLTDFGSADHFVGTMKGVILSLSPQTRIVDISHEVTPYSIAQARFLLTSSWPFFPGGTAHVVVVDPGVGSARRPLAISAGGHYFIGPDNGLFSPILERPDAKVRRIENQKWMLAEVSSTFHGRDVFAPVGARLAAGGAFRLVGPLVKDALRHVTGNPVRTGRRLWTGEVVHVDRFGNLITNFCAADYGAFSQQRFEVRIGFSFLHTLLPNYAAAAGDDPFLIVGSSGLLEIAVNQGSAARKLGCGVGTPVEFEVM